MAVFVIRLTVFALSGLAVALAAVPILVLISLLDGGTGYGLCPAGLELCDKPYSTGAEMAVLLVLALFGVVLTIRMLMKLAGRLRSDSHPASQ